MHLFQSVGFLIDQVCLELPGTPPHLHGWPAVADERLTVGDPALDGTLLLLGCIEHEILKALGMPQRCDVQTTLPVQVLVQFGKVFVHFRELHAGVG